MTTDLDLIRTRNLKWHRLVWPGGDQALVSDYNQLGTDRRALLGEIERLERENQEFRAQLDALNPRRAHDVPQPQEKT